MIYFSRITKLDNCTKSSGVLEVRYILVIGTMDDLREMRKQGIVFYTIQPMRINGSNFNRISVDEKTLEFILENENFQEVSKLKDFYIMSMVNR